MRFQVGELHFKSHRTGNIVGVHSRNEFPAGNINQSVEGWRQPLVGLSEQMYPSIPFGKAFENVRRVVSGTIIRDEEFKLGVTLLQDAFSGLSYKPLAVEDRHDD